MERRVCNMVFACSLQPCEMCMGKEVVDRHKRWVETVKRWLRSGAERVTKEVNEETIREATTVLLETLVELGYGGSGRKSSPRPRARARAAIAANPLHIRIYHQFYRE
jgi:hypothetical protein